MARGAMRPNDCDLAIVSMTPHKSPQWGELRLAMPLIVDATTQNLGLPVNIVLLTPGEWDELRPKFFLSSICLFSRGCVCEGYLN